MREPAATETLAEVLATVLSEHGPSGLVNSREGWVECECGERLQLPRGLTFDGYPEMWEEERKARDAHVSDALAAHIVQARAGGGLAYDDRLITCPECRSTFEAEDGTVVHQNAGEGALRVAARLEPAESMALTVAWAQVERGEHPMGNVAAVCVMALERIRRAALAETDQP